MRHIGGSWVRLIQGGRRGLGWGWLLLLEARGGRDPRLTPAGIDTPPRCPLNRGGVPENRVGVAPLRRGGITWEFRWGGTEDRTSGRMLYMENRNKHRFNSTQRIWLTLEVR